jgi:pantoate kinase
MGATGGGYVLSSGTRTKASLSPGSSRIISTVVNGDPQYNARTTRRAVGLLLASNPRDFEELRLEQQVETPIGSGFGASAASSISAVYAASAVLGIDKPKRDLATFAHRAEIIEQTGLGTVSVVYDGVGAGAITKAGEPGFAQFLNVKVPGDLRIVTAFLAPYDKKDALSSKRISEKINRLGDEALRGFLDDPSIDTLAEEGERFSRNLGLESPEVKKLAELAKSAGAKYACQNMIGYAIHSLVDSDRSERVVRALRGTTPRARVDIFRVGAVKAGVNQATRN